MTFAISPEGYRARALIFPRAGQKGTFARCGFFVSTTARIGKHFEGEAVVRGCSTRCGSTAKEALFDGRNDDMSIAVDRRIPGTFRVLTQCATHTACVQSARYSVDDLNNKEPHENTGSEEEEKITRAERRFSSFYWFLRRVRKNLFGPWRRFIVINRNIFLQNTGVEIDSRGYFRFRMF